MKAVKKLLVQSDKKMNDTITHGTLTLYVDTSYRPEHHRRQWGIAVDDFKEIKKGDKIYFHYLTLENDPQIPPDIWTVNYEMCYCVIRDDKVITLNDYLIVEITEEEVKSTIIIPDHLKKKNSTTRGFVKYTHHPQLKYGDEIMFRSIAAFENEIEDKTYYIMEHRDLLVKINK